jgi:hypothetical protein
MPRKKNPDVTFSELFAVISAARIQITETCEILGASRETWRGWRSQAWGMGPQNKARAEAMIAGVRFYIDRGVLPAHDRATHDEAIKKIRARVDRQCGELAA